MPLPSLYVNGQDVEALGLRLETCRGPWDAPAQSDPAITISGRMGVVRTGAPIVMPPRDIAITGKIFESSLARTNADLLAKLDTLKALFAIGLIEVRLVNQPTRSFWARLAGAFTVTLIGPAFAAVAADFSIVLTCTDPLGYDTELSGVGFGASPVAIALGTGPSGGIVRIMGPATNPVVTYRDLTGAPVHTLGLTRTLASTDYEEIDLDLMTIRRVQSGSSTNDIAALTSGDLEAFVLSPEDGDAIAGQWPTLECSGLTGAGNCELLFWRSFL